MGVGSELNGDDAAGNQVALQLMDCAELPAHFIALNAGSIPENASGEYFGLFDICGKGASFLGTMLIGVVTQITGKQNLGVAALSIMFVIGYLIFNKVSKMDD